jgi:hypothetical protein
MLLANSANEWLYVSAPRDPSASGLPRWQEVLRPVFSSNFAALPASSAVQTVGERTHDGTSATIRTMTLRTVLATAAGVALATWAGITGMGQQAGPELNVGDMAPGFNLPGSDGKSHQLADHKDKRAVVLAWFPKAFTGG